MADKKIEIQAGDIILTRDKGFVAWGIRMFMRKYAANLGVTPERYYNHVAVVIKDLGKLVVAESMIKGVQIKYSVEEYLQRHPDHKILTWEEPLSLGEKTRFGNTVIKFSRVITRYDFMNFKDQIKLIRKGIWTGKTGDEADKRLYCSELAAVAADTIRQVFKGQTWDKNPLDIQLCPHFKPLYGNE